MPTPCDEHKDRPQISCDKCYTNEELEGAIAKLNEFKVPPSPAQARKPKRLDDGKPKKRNWRDELFS